MTQPDHLSTCDARHALRVCLALSRYNGINPVGNKDIEKLAEQALIQYEGIWHTRSKLERWLAAFETACQSNSHKYVFAPVMCATARYFHARLTCHREVRSCEGYLQYGIKNGLFDPVMENVPVEAARAADLMVKRYSPQFSFQSRSSSQGLPPTEHGVTMLFRVAAALAFGKPADNDPPEERMYYFNGLFQALLDRRITFASTILYGIGKKDWKYAPLSYNEPLDQFGIYSKEISPQTRYRGLPVRVWVPDFFMRRVDEDADWMLFDPEHCADLDSLRGEALKERYCHKERQAEKSGSKTIKAREMWRHITRLATSHPDSGILFLDALPEGRADRPEPPAGGINVAKHIGWEAPAEGGGEPEQMVVDVALLKESTTLLTEALGDVLHFAEESAYFIAERPIAISTHGWADALFMLQCPYFTPLVQQQYARIEEIVFQAAVKASADRAKRQGKAPGHEKSPWYKMEWPIHRAHKRQQELAGGESSALDDPTSAPLMAEAKKGLYSLSLLADSTIDYRSLARQMDCSPGADPYPGLVWEEMSTFHIHPWASHFLYAQGMWNGTLAELLLEGRQGARELAMLPTEMMRLLRVGREIEQTLLVSLAAFRQDFMSGAAMFQMYIDSEDTKSVSQASHLAWRLGLAQTPIFNPVKS